MGQQTESIKASFLSLSARERLVFEGWQTDGWVRWLAGLRGTYERRMNAMCAILDEESHQLKQSTPVRDSEADWGVITKTRLISFDWPRGGMFIWVRIHLESHPLWQARGRAVPLLDGPALSSALMMYLTYKPHRVLAAPGSMFSATPEISGELGWRYMRLCFAAESDDNVEPCARNFGLGVQRFWRIKSVEEMEKLLDEMSNEGVESTQGLSNIGYGMGC